MYTAARDLPAYHFIREDDVRRDEIRSSELPDHAVTARDALLRHYTVNSISQDDPFDSTKLGPIVDEQALERRSVVGLSGSSADVLNGKLARGDLVDVLLSPKEAGTGRGARLQELLVLDVDKRSKNARDYVIVLAVSASEERLILRSAGSARAFFSRSALSAR